MKNKQINYDNFTIPFLSLFSGGGLLDLGFMNQGFQIQEAIEIQPYFIEAYNFALQNYVINSNNEFITKGLITHKSISAPVDASDCIQQARLGASYNGIWGLGGGPPCQDYSVGGNNAGIEGERGKLINSYLKIVELVQPKFLFFENVEGLYKTQSHQKAFKKFVAKIERLGYKVWYDILNVLEYGYPQDRPRIVLVAFKKDIIEVLKNSGYKARYKNDLLRSSNPENIFNWPLQTVKDPKSLKWPNKWPFNSINKNNVSKIEDEHTSMTVDYAFRGINSKTPNQKDVFVPKSKKFAVIAEGDTNRKSFKRLHRFKYSPTVAYGNNEVHLHPTEERRLSVREALRLQTAPDTYVLPSTVPLSHKFKLISNGVPVAKAELVAKEIRRTIINYLKAIENGPLVERKKK